MPVFEQDYLELGSRVACPCTTKPDVGSGRPAGGGGHEGPGVDLVRRDDQRPSGTEEAELLEVGRRVAMERGYQSVLLDDPADYA
jgi:hypothetical protein